LKTLLEIETGRLKEAHNVKLQIEPNPEFEHSAADSADAPAMSPPIDNPHSRCLLNILSAANSALWLRFLKFKKKCVTRAQKYP